MLMLRKNERCLDRGEVYAVRTPTGSSTWEPVPHGEVLDAVTEAIHDNCWKILKEEFGLATEGQKLFGVMTINRSGPSEWQRCIGLRNSHDKTLSIGLTAGISVLECSNWHSAAQQF